MTSPKQPVQVKPTPSEEKCDACEWRASEIGYPSACPKHLPTPSAQDGWEESLICEVMDDYLLDARNLSRLDVEPMQKHFDKLKSFISALLLQQRTEIEESVRGVVPKSKQHRVMYSQESKGYDREAFAVGFNSCRSEMTASLDKLFAKPTK